MTCIEEESMPMNVIKFSFVTDSKTGMGIWLARRALNGKIKRRERKAPQKEPLLLYFWANVEELRRLTGVVPAMSNVSYSLGIMCVEECLTFLNTQYFNIIAWNFASEHLIIVLRILIAPDIKALRNMIFFLFIKQPVFMVIKDNEILGQ